MKKYALSAILAPLLFVGAGCITFNAGGSSGGGADGGLWKTADRGDSWQQKASVATTTAQKLSIGDVNVTTVVQDPEDPKALYIGTTDNGMFYSYDGGDSWQQNAQVGQGRIPSIAISTKNKCTVYAAIGNTVIKTIDCSRTWTTPYVDSRKDKLTTSVVVDFYDPQVVWIANNEGDVLRSGDGGVSWTSVHSFQNGVLKMAMSAADSRRLYVGTKNNGVWRTTDGGATWTDVSQKYAQFSGSRDFLDIALGVSNPAVVILATKYGLLRSTDGGDSWGKIDLLTPPGTAPIYSVAVDPKDPAMLYYGTATAFYRSPNGGANWIPKKLPTSRAATSLLVDRINSSALYMGVTRFK